MDSFAIAKQCKDGRRGSCKECRRATEKENWLKNINRPSRHPDAKRKERLKRVFGITPEDYDSMLLKQKNVCAICKLPNHWNRRDKSRLAIDHDHKTGLVRGLLCHPCNQSLGLMQDDPSRLIAAAAYLLQNEQINED